jgi:pteridine reductase
VTLQGKRALVTGAGKRLGQAIAVRLARAGMDVAVHYSSSRDGAEHTAERVRAEGRRALVLGADLNHRDQARALVAEAVAGLGGLDLFVGSAANFERIPFDQVDDAAVDRALALNLSANLALSQAAAPALRQSRGSIVLVTCSSATTPFKNYLPYVVSKGAVKHLMKTLALELAPEIRVNAVAPGTVLPPDDLSETSLRSLAESVPLRRLGSAEDVANAVVFLAESGYVTGEEIHVDGGRSVVKTERFG